MNALSRLAVQVVAVGALLAPGAAAPQLIISANDEKLVWDDAGKTVFLPPGKDSFSVIDISNRTKPRIVASIPLMNTVIGPPTNLALTPDNRLALVANSMQWVQDGEKWKGQPDDKVYVIDLSVTPPAQIGAVTVGKQPSGLAINRAGNLALVANRAENSVSVLSISGKQVALVETIPLAAAGAPNEQVAAVAITPDGKRALAAKFATHKAALLAIDGQKVTYSKYDMAVGLWPYNVQITPDGKLGITANNGNAGASDGQADTVSIIDLELTPPRVVDQVVVGDGPEGLAVSPTGRHAAAIILNGAGNVPKDAFFHHDRAYVSLLRIDGKKVRKVSQIDVGGLAEGAVFSPDGKYLYVGNFLDRDMTVLRVDGDKLVKVGSLQLPGRPAAMRGNTP